MPTNMAFHDLTSGKIAPRTAKNLLGLGGKFIVTPHRTNGEGELFASTDRLERDFHLKVYFAGAGPQDQDREVRKTKLFVKSEWRPEDGDIPYWVDTRLSKFFVRVRRMFNKKQATSNLLPCQERLLTQLTEDNTLLFPDTDKGCGPCCVTYEQYMNDCLRHLTDTNVYQRLSEADAKTATHQVFLEIMEWTERYEKKVDGAALNCIMSSQAPSPFGQFYIMYKVHKEQREDASWPTRLVCSDVTSYSHILGKWVMERLQPVAQCQPSYFKDTFELKKMLDDMELPHQSLHCRCRIDVHQH
jgi:hypothetical protein